MASITNDIGSMMLGEIVPLYEDDNLDALRDELMLVVEGLHATIRNVNKVWTSTRASLDQDQRYEFGSKAISKNKIIANLKTLGDDKAGFKEWYDKFINAITQTYPKFRSLMT